MTMSRRAAVGLVFLYLAGSFVLLLLRSGWRPPHCLPVPPAALTSDPRPRRTRGSQANRAHLRPSPLEQLRRTSSNWPARE